MHNNKKIILLLIVVFLCVSMSFTFGNVSKPNNVLTNDEIGKKIVNINIGASYSSEDLHNITLELAEKYPKILEYKRVGMSFDGRPLYTLIMTEDINSFDNLKKETHGIRDHHLIETGTHARENNNPIFVLNMVEDYARAYSTNSKMYNTDIRKMLKKHVFHFYLMTNPDGFDLTRQGLNAVRLEETKEVMANINDSNYSRYKANMRGVDINRNFNTMYISKETGDWEEFHGTVQNEKYFSPVPNGDYFGGYTPASEPETKALQKYMLEYNFRNLISVHSRGQVLYWDKKYMSNNFNDYAYELVKKYNKSTGYMITAKEPWEGELTGVGYMSDWSASRVNKPLITVETLHWTVQLPASQQYYSKEYERIKELPIVMAKESEKKGVFKYHLYDKNGLYVRDYIDLEYAKGNAKLINGSVIEKETLPKYNNGNLITRKKFLEKTIDEYVTFVETIEISKEKFDNQNKVIVKKQFNKVFPDYSNHYADFALNNNIISKNGKFHPNNFITSSEAAIILTKVNNWFETFAKEQDLERAIAEKEFGVMAEELTPYVDNIKKWALLETIYAVKNNLLKPEAFKDKSNLLSEEMILRTNIY